MALPLTRLPLLLAVPLCACSGSTTPAQPPTAEEHKAHGHAVAFVEHSDEGSEPKLERVEDEDTRWVELPHFGECPYDADEVPTFKPANDKDVPGLDPERTRPTNMHAGDERIHNEALLERLEIATSVVLECVSVSACYDDRALEPGSIDLKFAVSPSGDVRGVDVEATPGLDHSGVRPCARLAIWETDFPAYDGADMLVSYQLDID